MDLAMSHSLPGIQMQAQSRNEVCTIIFLIKEFRKSYVAEVRWPFPSDCLSKIMAAVFNILTIYLTFL